MPNLMYHFVGCDESLKGISLERFRAQLDHLLRSYPRDEVVVTFDHGTIDHFENVAPELETRGLRGMFFILTMVQEDRQLCDIDKQRLLEASFRKDLGRMLCAELQMSYRPDDAREHLRAFHFYSPEERYLRYLRDKVVAADAYGGFIERLFAKFCGDEKDFVSRKYMSWKQVAELHQRGHTIGSHTHAHYGDKADFAKSLKLIERYTGEKPDSVSYPNGWVRVSGDDLAAVGVRHAYISTDAEDGPYRLGRIDCNQFDVPESAAL